MPNSTTTLQNVVDFAKTIGDLTPVLSSGGYSLEPARTIANDVMTDMLSEMFNWKWNRVNITPFYTISWQQDYPMVGVTNLAWIEHCYLVDINNTQRPQPVFWPEVVRDLERTSVQAFAGRPAQICWLPNDQLTLGIWPGAATVYTQPLGAINNPSNPIANFLDSNGNILVLSTFGTTGGTAPAAASGAAAGTTVNDGSCVWKVADSKGQGFRVSPIPPQTGVVYQVNVIGQMRPPQFANTLNATIEPIPDDFSKYFRDGFIAYAHRNSANPNVRAKYPQMKVDWENGMKKARGKADREKDNAGFYPDRMIMSQGLSEDPGPAWPFSI